MIDKKMKMDQTEFINKYISHLNPKQRQAVQTIQGPVLLLAVPGSGKTTVLVNRLGYMVFCEGIPAQNILTLTYTVAATNDMAKRFTAVFGEEYSGLLEFRTINGICAKIIQQYSQMIGKPPFELVTDEKVLGKIVLDILVKKMKEYPTDSDVKAVKTLITYSKNMMLTEEEIKGLESEAKLPLYEIYAEYNTYLRNHSLMDYDDQMIYAYRMLKSVPDLLDFYQRKYRYICVDEAQDTSKIQHIIISLIAGRDGNLFMVGDEDQSIYGFRAAYPEALLHFEKEHPEAKVLVMDQNYRSNAKIVEVADRFIQHNKDRHKKHMVSTREASSDIRYIDITTRSNQYAYLEKIAADVQKETAVLYRDNESILPLIDRMERKGIPYQMKNVDMAFFTNRVVVDVTNILLFAMNPYDTELFMKIYFKCKTFLKKAQAEAMCAISCQTNIPILEAAGQVDGLSGMVVGKCRALQTNLKSLLTEAPSKALFRIEAPVGYGEYLERNSIDDNKLFILKMLATNETTVTGFLDRLDYLKELLKNKRTIYDSRFILSTIHSSKGLEYDTVYLMDVCDGVFPANVMKTSTATKEEKRTFEEERRLFYVGMTRAKNELCIFRLSGNTSCFLKELRPKLQSKVQAKGKPVVQPKAATKVMKEERPGELVIGERVVQVKYGSGVISDVIYDEDGKADRFTVTFDSGEERDFIYPIAFRMGMKIDK